MIVHDTLLVEFLLPPFLMPVDGLATAIEFLPSLLLMPVMVWPSV